MVGACRSLAVACYRHRIPVVPLLAVGLTVACAGAPEPLGDIPPVAGQTLEALPPLVVAHAGQGSPAHLADGPAVAAQAALQALVAGEPALESVMAGIEPMEDDPRFNAGTGANLRLDGKTIETDAAIMDSHGHFGAVSGLAGVRHPIRVARAMVDTPHLFLAGPGANAFAATCDVETRSLETERARNTLASGWRRLFSTDEDQGSWQSFDWRAHWNFEADPPATLQDALQPLQLAVPAPAGSASADAVVPTVAQADVSDTVGVVLRTAEGHYAAGLSTGGTSLALRGRVGDVPQLGAGLYAGEHGAVAATGKGEAIVRERVAADVYRLLAAGVHPDAAIRRVIRRITREEGVGVIAVSERGFAARATSQMAWAAVQGGPQPQSHRADTVIW